MNSPNEDRKPAADMELLKNQASGCGPGCGCKATVAPGKMRWVLIAIVLVAAGAVVVGARMKKSGAETSIGALSELDSMEKEMRAVFLFVPGKDGAAARPLSMSSAKRSIEAEWGIKIGLFDLKPGSRDYDELAAKMSLPGVLVILKGGARCAISGDLTETNLIRGFTAAVNAGACCPLGTDE
jgi:hypothetical protein